MIRWFLLLCFCFSFRTFYLSPCWFCWTPFICMVCLKSCCFRIGCSRGTINYGVFLRVLFDSLVFLAGISLLAKAWDVYSSCFVMLYGNGCWNGFGKLEIGILSFISSLWDGWLCYGCFGFPVFIYMLYSATKMLQKMLL